MSPTWLIFDPSETTAGFGGAMAHTELLESPTKPGTLTPHVIVDFVKRWDPKRDFGGTIDFESVTDDIVQWVEWYRPIQVTFDQRNGQVLCQMVRQKLIQKGLTMTNVFVEQRNNVGNWQAWQVLKTAMNLGLVHVPPDCPDSEYTKKELKNLRKIDTNSPSAVPKVDRTPQAECNTKDVTDCVRDTVWHLIGSHMIEQFAHLMQGLQMQGGSPGGYQIGGRQSGGPSFEDFYANRGAGMSQPRSRGARIDRRF